jgi:hypothetical protein
MSTVTLARTKGYLRVTQTVDDDLIQDLIDAAEAECLAFLDRPALPKKGEYTVDECDSNLIVDPASDSDDLAPDVRGGIWMIVQAQYEGQSPDDVQKARAAAEVKWFPYRNKLGV